jgi:hypothetical protein
MKAEKSIRMGDRWTHHNQFVGAREGQRNRAIQQCVRDEPRSRGRMDGMPAAPAPIPDNNPPVQPLSINHEHAISTPASLTVPSTAGV